MAEVTIYTTSYCPYCHAAKSLLARKGVAFQEVDVTHDPEERARLVKRTGGRRTVPQVFIAGQSIGGYDELAALESGGQLDVLLAGA
ncbi:MAG TPA: glutaredoxin 3 [Candidatus Binatia bacterium]|nr:glutaredoxin 3 [Candidatus Binatia bacterium]